MLLLVQVTCYTRTEQDQLLVIASDGLWDVLTNDCVARIALQKFRWAVRVGSRHVP